MKIYIDITEVKRDKKYNVKFKGKLVYVIERDYTRADGEWVLMAKGSNDILDQDQYRMDLFERVSNRIKNEITVHCRVKHKELID